MTANRSRGHSAGLTRSAILRAAVGLADEEGLSAVSMRRLAADLGVEAMTLYHHVPHKEALLDGMVEQVISEVAPPRVADREWRDVLRDHGRALRTTLVANPNLVPLLASRPAMTPLNLDTLESALRMLCSAGFGARQALDVLHSLTGFVLGHVSLDAATRSSGQVPASPDVDPVAHPLFHEAVHNGENPRSRFDFALEALLSGFAVTAD